MRIVEPEQLNKEIKKTKKRFSKKSILLVTTIFLIGIWYYKFQISNKVQEDQNAQENPNSSLVIDEDSLSSEQSSTNRLRIFTDNEFAVFYDQLLQPNLIRVNSPPVITGNDIADARIRKIAEDRGYKLRSSPSVNMVSSDGFLGQQEVIQSWKDLRATASSKGLSMSVVSSYRNIEDQRRLFLSSLSSAGASVTDVANGQADETVNKILVTSSLPGYSKHHTGYTVDFQCAGVEFENFKNSSCNDWLSADNYKVAKEHGFIPSYPPLADSQGPDPEAWEYVWVGVDLLYEK